MSKHIEELTQSILIKKKHPFNLSFALVFTGPLLTAITLFILNRAGVNEPPVWANWVMFAIFVPLIITSLIIGQKRELVGAYGETILLLIPTFVWLLPGHEQALNTMIILAFAIVLIGFIIYSSANILRAVRHQDDDKNRRIANVLLRIGFVASTVTSTVLISIILIDWADHSLHLADKTVGKEVIQDYSVTGWIVFISTVTIIDALMLVILGLISSMKDSHVSTFNETEFGYYKNKKGNKDETKKVDIVEKTMLIDLKKRNKRK